MAERKIALAGLIAAFIGVTIALLNWIHPFHPVGPSPFRRTGNLIDTPHGSVPTDIPPTHSVPKQVPSYQPSTPSTDKNNLSSGTPGAVGVYPQQPVAPKTVRNSIGMEFVLIPVPAEPFKMGSDDSDADADRDEKDMHPVHLTRPFYLGKYEVTQAQWEAVMGNNPSTFKGDSNRPVENVSWDDVQEFIRRLNSREGGAMYRLPTEAEWEYTARAGTTTRWSFGDEARQLGRYAWYDGNAGGQTHPVGQLQPNPWGLYDMHGNVWEWVQDWYDSEEFRRRSRTGITVVDPVGPSSGSRRVNRGGCWINPARFCRTADRYHGTPGERRPDLGLRLLRVAQ
jgi:formylglycine-generating enzyme required for sulfatase activity